MFAPAEKIIPSKKATAMIVDNKRKSYSKRATGRAWVMSSFCLFFLVLRQTSIETSFLLASFASFLLFAEKLSSAVCVTFHDSCLLTGPVLSSSMYSMRYTCSVGLFAGLYTCSSTVGIKSLKKFRSSTWKTLLSFIEIRGQMHAGCTVLPYHVLIQLSMALIEALREVCLVLIMYSLLSFNDKTIVVYMLSNRCSKYSSILCLSSFLCS